MSRSSCYCENPARPAHASLGIRFDGRRLCFQVAILDDQYPQTAGVIGSLPWRGPSLSFTAQQLGNNVASLGNHCPTWMAGDELKMPAFDNSEATWFVNLHT